MKINGKLEEDLEKLFRKLPQTTDREIRKRIEKELNRCGLMYRAFSRCKSEESVKEKLARKYKKYAADKTKMQDFIGIRIVLYFQDDIGTCIRLLKDKFQVVGYEHDQPDAETFRPQRINYVFRLPEDIFIIQPADSDACLIDNTFEVQIRTIFSEGWHEVEHDIRYKCQNEWEGEQTLARELNGIFAVLEICDNNILAVCDKMAYQKYKNHDWESMIRHKFRLRMSPYPLSDNVKEILNQPNLAVGKELFRFNREKVILFFNKVILPKTCDNIVFVCNELGINNEALRGITPTSFIDKCRKVETDYGSFL